MVDEIDPNQTTPPDAKEPSLTPPQPASPEASPPIVPPAEEQFVSPASQPAQDSIVPPTAAADPTVPASGEEIKPLPKRKTMSIIIHDAGVLRAAYMQFVKGGGLFIPTKKPFVMGEDTNLVIRLLDDDEPYRVSGKVVWITPSGAPGAKAGGIGVEFADDKNGERLRSRIEIILGPHLKSTESTHTM